VTCTHTRDSPPEMETKDNTLHDTKETSSFAIVLHSHADNHVDRLTLPFRIFQIRDQTLKIHQAFKRDGSGGTVLGHGAAVYPASIILSDYLDKHANLYNKNVLELGGGHGYSGIAAAVCGAKYVVTTDGDDVSLSLTQKNINENNVNTNCHAMKLLWGDTNHIEQVKNAFYKSSSSDDCNAVDVIIGSDITACPYADALPMLIDTLEKLSTKSTIILLSHKSRNVEEELFWDQASIHFKIKKLDRFMHSDFVNDESLHLSMLKKI
jgi:protein N-lysine methyltransferase METTL21A